VLKVNNRRPFGLEELPEVPCEEDLVRVRAVQIVILGAVGVEEELLSIPTPGHRQEGARMVVLHA
jgi:hypothetical protein